MIKWSISRRLMTVQELRRLQGELLVDPGYQREGGLWSKERRQLFLDSLINGFDVPPIYLHRLAPPAVGPDGIKTHAVIDGQQRLTALWAFLEGNLRLARDFRVVGEPQESADGFDEQTALGGLDVWALQGARPGLYYQLLNYELPVTVVETDDEALIEELFFRLNEGVPLTPAEKRHRGALLRSYLVPLVADESPVFGIVRFRNRRRTYEDLLLRLLFIEEEMSDRSAIPDMKKASLDAFARSFGRAVGEAPNPREEALKEERLKGLVSVVTDRLEEMRSVFADRDPLLRTVNWFLTYYLLVRDRSTRLGGVRLNRDDLERFWFEVGRLGGTEEDAMSADQLEALELAGAIPASTTGSYYQRRVDLLNRYLDGDLQLEADGMGNGRPETDME